MKQVQSDGKTRCSWVNLKNSLYVRYHDEEWGVPCHDERALFELLILELFQAGLSWETVLNKRAAFRRAYAYFDPEKVAAFTEEKTAALLADAGLIRNRCKIAASVQNADAYLRIQEKYGSFDHYIWHFTDGKTVVEPDPHITSSPLSDAVAGDLKKHGMTFLGTVTVYAYLQAIGVINAHQKDCFLCASCAVL